MHTVVATAASAAATAAASFSYKALWTVEGWIGSSPVDRLVNTYIVRHP